MTLNTTEDLYKFHTFNHVESLNPETGKELLSGELAGIVINNFISPSEIDSLLKGFYSLKKEDLIRINDGFISYPISFAQYTQQLQSKSTTEKDFHGYARQLRNNFQNTFGIDIESKLANLFANIFPGKEVSVPVDRNNFGSFIPFNFRELLPKYGELKIHCENLFFNEFPLFFELMAHEVLRKNDFSFFIVLQKAEQGGELSLFDKRWNSQEKQTFSEIGDTNNYVLEIEKQKLNKQLVSPPAGSIVLFSGGDIWHKVETVEGNKSRVTLGGFLSSGVHDGKMFMWS